MNDITKLKFCKDCVHSFLSMRSHFTEYECHHISNIAGADIVDGMPIQNKDPRQLRTNPEACGMDAKWFEQKALPRGYENLGYNPDGGPVYRGETSAERLERLRREAKSNVRRSTSLKNVTVEDL